MLKVPHFLYTTKIINTVKGFICNFNSEDFDSLKDYEKDMLIAHALDACEHDIEIVVSRDVNKAFTQYVSSYKSKEYIKFIESVKQDYYDYFSFPFNTIFKEVIDELKQDRAHDMRWAS